MTPNFSLQELTTTNTGLANTLTDPVHKKNLQRTAQMMEVVRGILGNRPIKVNSGYRSPAVNKAVGGVPNSAHALGYAVDFVCPSYGDPYSICLALQKAGIQFDQIIHEKRAWVHISFDPRFRGQLLTLMPGSSKYLTGIIK